MQKTDIPNLLTEEFATVKAILNSNAKTRGVDALLLTWVKYEKQLRRLFCFLLFQNSEFSPKDIDGLIYKLVQNNKLYPETFIRGIQELTSVTISALLGEEYLELDKEISRIKKYRNKLMHGQITGDNLSRSELEKDVFHLVRWIDLLGQGAENLLGYDGLKRNTLRNARNSSKVNVKGYPFPNLEEFEKWLNKLANQ